MEVILHFYNPLPTRIVIDLANKMEKKKGMHYTNAGAEIVTSIIYKDISGYLSGNSHVSLN